MTDLSTKPKTAIEQVYDRLTEVFGATNPNQFFTLMMPGSLLNPQDFQHDPGLEKPARVARAESALADQMFDLAKVNGSSNGQHVSSQYLQALSCLVPKFDKLMPEMKARLRDFVTTPAAPDAEVDGKPFTGTLAQHYFAMYRHWLSLKSDWEQQYFDQREKLSPNQYLEWYETHAETPMAKIDAAYGELVSTFPPSDMEAILGALDSGPAGEIDLAEQIVKDIRVPTPSGGYVYPVEFVPSDWSKLLNSEIDPRDLLSDPEFIGSTLTTKRRALQTAIRQVDAIVGRLPKEGAVDEAAKRFTAAKGKFSDSDRALSSKYADNTLTAVQILAKSANGPALLGKEALTDPLMRRSEEVLKKVAEARGQEPPGRMPSEAELKEIASGHHSMLEAQKELVDSLGALSEAAVSLQSARADVNDQLPGLLANLRAQLEDLGSLEDQLQSAVASRDLAAANGVPGPSADEAREIQKLLASKAFKGSANALLKIAGGLCEGLRRQVEPMVLDGLMKKVVAATLPQMKTAAGDGCRAYLRDVRSVDEFASRFNVPADLAKIDAAALGAKATEKVTDDGLAVLQAELARRGTSSQALMQALVAAVKATARKADPADPNANLFPCWAAVLGEWKACTDAIKKGASPDDTTTFSDTDCDRILKDAVAVLMAGRTTRPRAAEQAGYRSPFMTLRMSFSCSEMNSEDSVKSGTSSTARNGGLFFFGGAGSSRTTFATTAHEAIDSSTEIEIAFQAAKVELQREWLDPGVFKLTPEMHRLVKGRTTHGTEGVAAPSQEEDLNGWFDWANQGLLPCIPVAFVVAKDITIRFKALSSQVNTVREIVDSTSASGGGFFCFRAASSSQSHSDTSGVHARTEGNVFSITMPAPQILGWFLEVMPADASTPLSDQPDPLTGKIGVTEFVRQLSAWRNPARAALPPTQREAPAAGRQPAALATH